MDVGKDFEKLVQIIATLRGEGGCPWDREQTPETVKRYLVEEAYEAVSEVERRNSSGVMEELGDLIFMTLFMAYLFQQRGDFTIEDVLKKAAAKMIYRHPHVFANRHVESPDEVKENWERLKKQEKSKKSDKLDIPRSLPALMRAHRLVGRAWSLSCPDDNPPGIRTFICNQLKALEDLSGETNSADKARKHMGESLMAMVCLGRKYGINAEDVLHEAIQRRLESSNPAAS
ncbi:MAG: nucleoside triphosphate pyrophosphohydrolase [Deltaproteobacteria bacterium]|nr:MAG: nucleoside triphosphate pyrophosphohydrolase [Deltaproteobacteria bacterium]